MRFRFWGLGPVLCSELGKVLAFTVWGLGFGVEGILEGLIVSRAR